MAVKVTSTVFLEFQKFSQSGVLKRKEDVIFRTNVEPDPTRAM